VGRRGPSNLESFCNASPNWAYHKTHTNI
jgi:hypothetical protein